MQRLFRASRTLLSLERWWFRKSVKWRDVESICTYTRLHTLDIFVPAVFRNLRLVTKRTRNFFRREKVTTRVLSLKGSHFILFYFFTNGVLIDFEVRGLDALPDSITRRGYDRKFDEDQHHIKIRDCVERFGRHDIRRP